VDTVVAETVRTLIDADDAPCISIYMPTHRSGKEAAAQGPIRLKNLLDQARQHLVESEVRPADADQILAEASRLTDNAPFWQHQEDGLAVFIAPGRTNTFRLPAHFSELVDVGDSFHLKPLWPVVASGEVFYLLALSRNRVRLLWGNRFRMDEIDLPGEIPGSLADALWFEDPEKQIQHRGADRVGRGRVVAHFHGHGTPDEQNDARVERFLQRVDGGLRHLIDRDTPLVLAGVDDIVALFRKVSDHRNLLPQHIPGNPDRLSPAQLHERAIPLIEPLLAEQTNADTEAFSEAGELAISDIETAIPAAHNGRVEAIFIPESTHLWGVIRNNGQEVEMHGERLLGDRDLLDIAATATWIHDGRVHVVPSDAVPGDGVIAAHLRY
jgi:hypothetical protein